MSNTNNQDESHQEVMMTVLKGLQNTPLVLKGGTALLFCYKLDRHSEDLDFDCPIKLNLKSKILNSLKQTKIVAVNLKVIKETPTTSRYKLLYKNGNAEGSLKIEIKNYKEIGHKVAVNGINTYPISELFNMKLNAANLDTGRAQVRDLYDLGHILKEYKNDLNSGQLEQANIFNKNLQKNLGTFSASHQEDKILKNTPLKGIAKTIQKSLLHDKIKSRSR